MNKPTPDASGASSRPQNAYRYYTPNEWRGPRVAGTRVHHTLQRQIAQTNVAQLFAAQSVVMHAHAMGADPRQYQAQLAVMNGVDPAILSPSECAVADPRAPLLGQLGCFDEDVYDHIELLSRYPRLVTVNQYPADAFSNWSTKFVLIKADREQLIHHSLKYCLWNIGSTRFMAVSRLNALFEEAAAQGSSVVLVFMCQDSRVFSGAAEMASPLVAVKLNAPAGVADDDSSVGGAEERDDFQCNVLWRFAKDIPLYDMKFVQLRAVEALEVFGPGIHRIGEREGLAALQTFERYPASSSVLLDFKFYDESEARGLTVESGHAAVLAAQGVPSYRDFAAGRGQGAKHHNRSTNHGGRPGGGEGSKGAGRGRGRGRQPQLGGRPSSNR